MDGSESARDPGNIFLETPIEEKLHHFGKHPSTCPVRWIHPVGCTLLRAPCYGHSNFHAVYLLRERIEQPLRRFVDFFWNIIDWNALKKYFTKNRFTEEYIRQRWKRSQFPIITIQIFFFLNHGLFDRLFESAPYNYVLKQRVVE